jgi:AraC family transcriptional activator of pobA
VVANHQYPQEKLKEFMDLLETNIGTTKQAAAYADMLSLSLFQLNSITKSLVGKTVAALIEDQILLEAKRHLLGTPNQVSQIAFQLGYEDVSYFIRFFRKRMGITPDAFRKNFR